MTAKNPDSALAAAALKEFGFIQPGNRVEPGPSESGECRVLYRNLADGTHAIYSVAEVEALVAALVAMQDAVQLMQDYPQNTGHHVENCKAMADDALAAWRKAVA